MTYPIHTLSFRHIILSVVLITGLFGALALPAYSAETEVEEVRVSPTAKYGLDAAGESIFIRGAGEKEKGLLIAIIAGKVINIALSVLGLVFLVLMVYAGILWLTSQGEDDKTKRARSLIFYAILGLMVVLGAYVITKFVLGGLIGVTLLNK